MQGTPMPPCPIGGAICALVIKDSMYGYVISGRSSPWGAFGRTNYPPETQFTDAVYLELWLEYVITYQTFMQGVIMS